MPTLSNAPLNSYELMKHEWKMNAFEASALRGYEVKYCKKARYLVNKEYLDAAERWATRRENTYTDRMRLRRCQRYLTLARAFHKGTPYLRVEGPITPKDSLAGARQHHVNTNRLQSELDYWNIKVAIEVLDEWVA